MCVCGEAAARRHHTLCRLGWLRGLMGAEGGGGGGGMAAMACERGVRVVLACVWVQTVVVVLLLLLRA